MIHPVLQKPDKILRQKAEEVPTEEIKSEKIQDIIQDMSDTLRSIDIGIGLAAPQIGHPLRIFIISEEALLVKRDKKNPPAGGDREEYKKHFVFINPKIIRTSEENELVPEGCLSVDSIFGQIKRAKKIVVEALNKDGKKFRRSASGLFAQALQHEIDHLNGILFIDTAINLKKTKEEKYNK